MRMRNLAQKVVRKIRAEWAERADRRHLSPLYSPVASDLDIDAHIEEAMAWLKRAQDAGADRGVSYGARFGHDFEASYPETTGYICQTFLEQEQLTGETDLLTRAIDMGDWEIAIQLPEGAVMGGKLNANPTPAVFNTGMVLLGWSALIRRTGQVRFKSAARRASDWLLSVQEPHGNWIRGNSKFAAGKSALYNVKAAWGLCEAGLALDDDRYVSAALRNADYCLQRQAANGWFPDCCLTDKTQPFLHTIAYAMQGLLNIGRLTDRPDLIAAARKTADAEIHIMGPDGFLPGRQDAQFRGTVNWCCLTGSAQTSVVWSTLYQRTGEEKYRTAADRINRYLMARHDIHNSDLRLRGGVPGAWPVWGEYGRLTILNWATKFLVDALTAQKYSSASSPAR